MKLLIIGNGVAGVSCAETVKKLTPDAEVTILSDEPHPFYSKSMLSYYLSGKFRPGDIVLRGYSFYKQTGIDLKIGIRAERIVPNKHQVAASDGRKYPYDSLLIATGASPAFPRKFIVGLEKKGVYGLRTLEDAEGILASLKENAANKTKPQAVILGGGLLGLESAHQLRMAGYQVVILEIAERLLTTVIDQGLAHWLNLEERFREEGYDLRTSARAVEVAGEEQVTGVVIQEGKKTRTIPADAVLVGTGVVTNSELARECGIAVDRGIVTDPSQRTSIPAIYAAGDCAQAVDFVTGGRTVFPIWPAATEQGRVAAYNICGKEAGYPGGLSINAFHLFGIPGCCMGLINPPSEKGYEELVNTGPDGPFYHRIILKDGVIVGTSLAGEIGAAGTIYRYMKEKTDVSATKDRLLQMLMMPNPKSSRVGIGTLW